MAYCFYNEVQEILAENVKIGDQNLGTPSPGRSGTGSNRSNISIAECQRYISFADSQVDSRLKPLYVTPLRRIKSYETPILNNIAHGVNVTIDMEDSGAFIKYNVVRIQDTYSMETANVTEVTSLTTIKLDKVTYDYSTINNLRISILKFPDPISLISARLAASFIMDRLYVQTQSPDISNFGKTQRSLATFAMDDILRGVMLLPGQDHTGRRFLRTSLLDKWSSPAEVQKGEEKET